VKKKVVERAREKVKRKVVEREKVVERAREKMVVEKVVERAREKAERKVVERAREKAGGGRVSRRQRPPPRRG
jgi:hypothetical protein